MIAIPEWLDDQLRRSFEGDAWHGPAVREALDGIDATRAAARPVPGAHSIWELVLHLGATYRVVLRRLAGESAELTPEEDWQKVPDATEVNWRATIDRLAALNRELRDAVRRFPVERLDQPLVPSPTYAAITQFIGITQHDLYHAGQIVLLKRAIERGHNTTT
jgi:uncharacterized damage-inducible protein DinB